MPNRRRNKSPGADQRGTAPEFERTRTLCASLRPDERIRLSRPGPQAIGEILKRQLLASEWSGRVELSVTLCGRRSEVCPNQPWAGTLPGPWA